MSTAVTHPLFSGFLGAQPVVWLGAEGCTKQVRFSLSFAVSHRRDTWRQPVAMYTLFPPRL